MVRSWKPSRQACSSMCGWCCHIGLRIAEALQPWPQHSCVHVGLVSPDRQSEMLDVTDLRASAAQSIHLVIQILFIQTHKKKKGRGLQDFWPRHLFHLILHAQIWRLHQHHQALSPNKFPGFAIAFPGHPKNIRSENQPTTPNRKKSTGVNCEWWKHK